MLPESEFRHMSDTDPKPSDFTEALDRWIDDNKFNQQQPEPSPDGSYAGRPGSLRWLVHNTIIHPMAGCLWFLGAEVTGDRLHDWHHNQAEVGDLHGKWWNKRRQIE